MKKLLRKIIFSVFGYKVTIEGSNDGLNWEYIATVRVKKNKSFKIPNTKAYNKYRFKGNVLWTDDVVSNITDQVSLKFLTV